MCFSPWVSDWLRKYLQTTYVSIVSQIYTPFTKGLLHHQIRKTKLNHTLSPKLQSIKYLFLLYSINHTEYVTHKTPLPSYKPRLNYVYTDGWEPNYSLEHKWWWWYADPSLILWVKSKLPKRLLEHIMVQEQSWVQHYLCS